MKNIFLLLLGTFFMMIGVFYIIIYLNVLTMGYSFLEFVKFIIMKAECLCLVVGIIVNVKTIERMVK
ncbi:MAG: hypothetical protein IJ574_04645 [Bacilli bacterium]|nr:hypothetical protein [Bacilli bacterium]